MRKSVSKRKPTATKKRKPAPKPKPSPAPTPSPGPTPKGPIQHVVIIVKENHGYDNYFGTYPGGNGATMPRSPNPPPHDPDHRHAAWLSRATTAA